MISSHNNKFKKTNWDSNWFQMKDKKCEVSSSKDLSSLGIRDQHLSKANIIKITIRNWCIKI